MIEIYVKGQALDLAPDASVSMVFNNSLFDSDVLQGSFSYPFTLPASPHNRLVLGFPEIIENLAELETEYECLFVYEALTINARLKMREVSMDSYSVNLFTQLGIVADQLQKKMLGELPLETVVLQPDPFPRMTVNFALDGPGPAVGAVLNFRAIRQNGSDVWYPVRWKGTLESYRQDLIAKINTSRTPQPLDPSKIYGQYELVTDANGNFWEAQFEGVVGQTLDDVHWILVCPASQWINYWRLAVTPKWYLYDDPMNDHSIVASQIGMSVALKDTSTGLSPLDYVLIWQQQLGGVNVQDGLQAIDSPAIDQIFDLNVRQMFEGAVAGKYPAMNYAFFPVHNPLAFDDALFNPSDPTLPYVNYWAQDRFVYALEAPVKPFCSPYPYLCHVLDKLFESLGVRMDNEAIGSVENLDRVVVYNTKSSIRLVKEVNRDTTLSRFPFSLSLGKHVPEITLGEFLNGVRQFLFLGVGFDFEGRKCRILALKDVLASEPTRDWTMKADSDYRLTEDKIDGFTLNYTHDPGDELIREKLPDLGDYHIVGQVETIADLPTQLEDMNSAYGVAENDMVYRPLYTIQAGIRWEPFGRNLYPLRLGGGQGKRQAKAAPILSDRIRDENSAPLYGFQRDWLVPTVRQRLSVPELFVRSPASLRLLFYWGLQPDAQGRLYPLGTSGNVRYDGSPLGGLALRYHGADGIAERLGKDWLGFIASTRRVTRSFYLTSLDLKSLEPSEKIQVDGINYFWRSCKVTFPIKKPAEFELWKL